MRCVECGNAVANDDAFCSQCGAEIIRDPQQRFCVACGFQLAPDDAYCMMCGREVGSLRKQPAPQMASTWYQELGYGGACARLKLSGSSYVLTNMRHSNPNYLVEDDIVDEPSIVSLEQGSASVDAAHCTLSGYEFTVSADGRTLTCERKLGSVLEGPWHSSPEDARKAPTHRFF